MVGLYGGKFGVCGLLRRDAGFYCGQYEGLLRVIRGSIGFYCGLMGRFPKPAGSQLQPC